MSEIRRFQKLHSQQSKATWNNWNRAGLLGESCLNIHHALLYYCETKIKHTQKNLYVQKMNTISRTTSQRASQMVARRKSAWVRFQDKCKHQTRADIVRLAREHLIEERQLNRRGSSLGLTEVFPIIGSPTTCDDDNNSKASTILSRICGSLQQEELPRAMQSAAISDSCYAPRTTEVERLMFHVEDTASTTNNLSDDELNPECRNSCSQHAIHLLL